MGGSDGACPANVSLLQIGVPLTASCLLSLLISIGQLPSTELSYTRPKTSLHEFLFSETQVPTVLGF